MLNNLNSTTMTAIFLTLALICFLLGSLQALARIIDALAFNKGGNFNKVTWYYILSCIFYGLFYYLTH